jgi:hypothetical protein
MHGIAASDNQHDGENNLMLGNQIFRFRRHKAIIRLSSGLSAMGSGNDSSSSTPELERPFPSSEAAIFQVSVSTLENAGMLNIRSPGI